MHTHRQSQPFNTNHVTNFHTIMTTHFVLTRLKLYVSHRFPPHLLCEDQLRLTMKPIRRRALLFPLFQVMFATNREGCNSIMQQFCNGSVYRRYLCVVDDIPEENIAETRTNSRTAGSTITVNAPIQNQDVTMHLCSRLTIPRMVLNMA